MKRSAETRLRQQLAKLLRSREAHLGFHSVIRGWPEKLRGVRPRGAPHTAWQLLEHIRICQWDILDFCRNPDYQWLAFEDYWPKQPAPPSRAAWEKSLRAFRADQKAMEKLVLNPKTDLFAPIPWGQGQTILREALLVADHNAYHLGQLVLLRRLLGAWKNR
ncbi:MAG: DinB family protein [Acidobacteria bacterium]|nr:DinB family protein [Acidobacteriota bacterium]